MKITFEINLETVDENNYEGIHRMINSISLIESLLINRRDQCLDLDENNSELNSEFSISDNDGTILGSMKVVCTND